MLADKIMWWSDVTVAISCNKGTILSKSSTAYLLYILILPLECIRLPFFNQDILGEGVPSAWHTNRAVPARGLVKLSGHSTNEGGAILIGKRKDIYSIASIGTTRKNERRLQKWDAPHVETCLRSEAATSSEVSTTVAFPVNLIQPRITLEPSLGEGLFTLAPPVDVSIEGCLTGMGRHSPL